MILPFYLILAVLVMFLLAAAFTRADAAKVADTLRLVVPIFLAASGILLTVIGRVAIGSTLIMIAIGFFGAMQRRKAARKKRGQRSTVRTAAIEMELDHDSGQLEGIVLAGSREGQMLRDLDKEALLALCKEFSADQESLQLLEAYLDSRFPGWREDSDSYSNAGQGHPAGSGPMTKQEAYQILGLEEGASAAAIRQAHRRLMQRVHPDLGGSSFLAARINEAKDLLLSGH
jgi:DnaJ-domain-containing protein 1